MAACFIALAVMPTDLPTLAQVCFTGATVFSGLNCVGVAKSAQMISRQYAHVLMAINAFTNSIIILLLPAFVTLLAPNNTVSEWSRIFVVIAVVVIVTTLWFDFTAEVQPRPWTLSSGKSSASTVSTESHESYHRLEFDQRTPVKATFVLDPAALQDPTLAKALRPAESVTAGA